MQAFEQTLSDNIFYKTPTFALEILVNIKENFPKPLMDFWGEDVVFDTLKWFRAAQKKAIEVGAKYVSIYFNIEDNPDFIAQNLELFNKIQDCAKIPLIVRGTGQKNFDSLFIPKLVENIKKPAIVAFAQDLNYEKIVKSILKSPLKDDIKLVLRAPIDINLTKELNVLTMDLGFPCKNILMDTDTGCVGMGLDYGYSIIERLIIAKNEGDSVLNPPVIVFSGEESFKSKESKSDDFKDSRGDLKTRAATVEIATTTALFCAGADFLVCQNPETISAILSLCNMETETDFIPETLGGVL